MVCRAGNVGNGGVFLLPRVILCHTSGTVFRHSSIAGRRTLQGGGVPGLALCDVATEADVGGIYDDLYGDRGCDVDGLEVGDRADQRLYVSESLFCVLIPAPWDVLTGPSSEGSNVFGQLRQKLAYVVD